VAGGVIGVDSSLLEVLALTADPELLMTRAGFAPDPWQRAVLGAGNRTLVLGCRQAGKGLAAAARATRLAATEPGRLVLAIDPSQRQSKQLIAKCAGFLPYLGSLGDGAVATTEDVRFPNGSRIVALPGTSSTIRGDTAHLIVVDEAAWVPRSTWEALVPMVAATGGDLLVMSSAGAPAGWFYEAWSDEAQPWERVKVTAADVPRIDPGWLELQRRAMPRDWFRREFFAEFVAIEGAVFRPEDIDAAVHRGPLAGWVPAALDEIAVA
jgi:hypothetical protein